MLYSLRLLLFLINIDQTTILNWFDNNLTTKPRLDTLQTINIDDPVYKSVESLKFLINNIKECVKELFQIFKDENCNIKPKIQRI